MTRYFTPIPALTGALHEQPPIEQLRDGLEFTPDYKVAVDCRGSLDAPECIPTGSVRAQDHERLRLGVSTCWRGRA